MLKYAYDRLEKRDIQWFEQLPMPVSTFVQGCIVGLFIFADCILLFFGVNSNILKAFKSLPEKVKTDQVEVEEVTYSGSSVRSGRYTRVCLGV